MGGWVGGWVDAWREEKAEPFENGWVGGWLGGWVCIPVKSTAEASGGRRGRAPIASPCVYGVVSRWVCVCVGGWVGNEWVGGTYVGTAWVGKEWVCGE